MSTVFSSIVTAFVSKLEQAPAVCSTVYRAHQGAIPEQIEQAVNVRFEDATAQRGAIEGAPLDWIAKVTVECFARSGSVSGDLAVDPLLHAVYARLAQDATLGGAVDDIGAPAVEAENTGAAVNTGTVRLTYAVQVRTGHQDLS